MFKRQNKQNNRIIRKSSAGFTLVEALVSIAILMIAVTGPMVFASNGLRAAYYSRDQITAFYLAQDAMELIRNIKESSGIKARLGSGTWLDDFGGVDCDDSDCGIDHDSPLALCSSLNSCVLKYYEDTHLYQHDEGSDSRFSRKIRISPVGTLGNEIKVVVTVTWYTAGFAQKDFVAEAHLFKW